MKKRYLGIVALAALPATLATASQFHHVGGAACGTSFNNGTQIQRGPGITNWGSSSIIVECPVDITAATSVNPITVNPSTARVEYVALNPDPNFGHVGCRFMLEDSTATIVSGPWQYSCATPGGCTTATTTFNGIGFLTIPDTIAATANVVALEVQCQIPALLSGFGTSTVYGVAVATTTP